MKAFGLTDTGRQREKNEDNILLNDLISLYVVADGMGGHVLGEVASRTAVDAINRFLERKLLSVDDLSLKSDDHIKELLLEAVTRANKEIHDYSRNEAGGGIMGTTLSLVLLVNKKAYTAHVGDSRIYRLRKASIEKLTKDHSKAQELIDAGLLKEEEAENHRLSHVLTKALGSSNSVVPDIRVFELKNRDSFFLSTDGLFRVLSVGDVTTMLMGGLSIQERCRILMAKALEGGAPDNVSFILLEPDKEGILTRIFS